MGVSKVNQTARVIATIPSPADVKVVNASPIPVSVPGPIVVTSITNAVTIVSKIKFNRQNFARPNTNIIYTALNVISDGFAIKLNNFTTLANQFSKIKNITLFADDTLNQLTGKTIRLHFARSQYVFADNTPLTLQVGNNSDYLGFIDMKFQSAPIPPAVSNYARSLVDQELIVQSDGSTIVYMLMQCIDSFQTLANSKFSWVIASEIQTT